MSQVPGAPATGLKLIERGLEQTIFWSRWLQAPIYVGLIIAQVLYCYKFAKEVALLLLMTDAASENKFLLAVLTLIDIAMVANLITMVVIGGYATFVSKLDLDENDDRPDWLSHIDPGAIKVKLSGSLVGISSIHLLKSFLIVGSDGQAELAHAAEAGHGELAAPLSHADILWQVVIHLTFVASTILLAFTEFVMHRRYRPEASPATAPPDKNE